MKTQNHIWRKLENCFIPYFLNNEYVLNFENEEEGRGIKEMSQ